MTRDKKILYILSAPLVLVLLGLLFLPRDSGRVITALLLVAFAVAVHFFVKKRPIPSINKRMVLVIMLAMGAVCLVLYYMTGAHFGFYKSSTPLSIRNFFRYVLPITTIIITIEFIRYVFLAQSARFMGILVYIMGILSELLMYSTLTSVTTFNRFMDVVGLYLFPAITANLLYNFLAKNYGFLPGIAYRLIMTLYSYVLPAYPKTPDVLFSFVKILIPLAIYAFLQMLYFSKKRYQRPRSRIANAVSLGLSALFMISIVLLISNEFRYRTLIIATESMTGEINQGDAIIYETYTDQSIEEEDILVFRKSGSLIVHRVVQIEHINGETRYYTKGDANEDMDTGYITNADIEGAVLFKIPQIGQVTLWMREAFKK